MERVMGGEVNGEGSPVEETECCGVSLGSISRGGSAGAAVVGGDEGEEGKLGSNIGEIFWLARRVGLLVTGILSGEEE